MGNFLNKTDKKRIDKIMIKLVAGNMAAGSNYEKAKAQAFNRMEKEYHIILMAWCLDAEQEGGE